MKLKPASNRERKKDDMI